MTDWDRAVSKADAGKAMLLEMLGSQAEMPADEVIRRLTWVEIGTKPLVPLALVLARPDVYKDRLLAEISLAPADIDARFEAAPDERHAYVLHTFAVYLLGLWQEPRAFRPLLAYLAADPGTALAQLQETITEDLHAILARVYDGSDLTLLKTIIETPGAEWTVRNACLKSLHSMARLRKLPRADVVAYMTGAGDVIAAEPELDWADCLAVTLAELQEPALRPHIDRIFRICDVDENFLRPTDIDATYAETSDVLDESLLLTERFDNLTDYLFEWAWFNVTDPAELIDLSDDPATTTADDFPEVLSPVVREGRKIGRNEPCPCGSSLKYKKCCLGKTAS